MTALGDDVREARASWLVAVFQGEAGAESASEHVASAVLSKVDAERLVETLRNGVTGRELTDVRNGPVDHVVTVLFGPREGDAAVDASPVRVECHLDGDGLISGVAMVADTHPGIDMVTSRVSSLGSEARAGVHDLFALTYDEANHDYLDKSLSVLQHIATAYRDGQLIGFALGGRTLLELPDPIGPTTALLAGLCCVHPDSRRQGLFRRLSNLALLAGGPLGEERTLGAGRMAHPTSMRVYKDVPWVVPKPGVRPTELQQSVGAIVAAAYGATDFDPETFVVRGSGTPIGYPNLEQEVEPEEWKVFDPVDRSRGDALLAVIFRPDPPPGW